MCTAHSVTGDCMWQLRMSTSAENTLHANVALCRLTACVCSPYKSLFAGPNNVCAAPNVSSLLALPAFSSLMATKNWLNCSYDRRALQSAKQ